MTPRHDIAIYAPEADSYYDAAQPLDSGGAERQTFLLAQAMARRGLRVAHVVYPVAEPVIAADAPVTLVQRPKPPDQGPRGFAVKLAAVWSGLRAADASVQVFRGANGTLGVGGAWARAHRRRLIFAGANNSDFTMEGFPGRGDPRARLFRAGMRMTDGLVVQSDDQVRLAHEHFPRAPEPRQINSFVAPGPPPAPGQAFLWVSRLVDYKRPLLYADLAAAMPEARFWMLPIVTGDDSYATFLAELRRRAGELDNLELLDQRPHAELQRLIGDAVAMVNTSSFEGMPNTWLEGWSRGVPALTLSFDPDGRIAAHGLGVAADGSWEDFVGGARRLWEAREDRGPLSETVRAYVGDAHGTRVGDAWAELVLALRDR